MFIRNAWYVAAWDHEVHRLQMLRRTLLGEAVVLYRKSDGTPVALEDRCAHRQAPLSKGKVIDDNVQCAYHGLTYDPSGKCIHIPSQDEVPPNITVRSYPVVERYCWIWIWMGNVEAADEALIEDFHWMDDPDWRFKGERLDLEGNYILLVENLMDLSHLPFVHPSTFSSSSIQENEIPVKTEREGDLVRVTRWVLDTPAPPYFQKIAGFKRGQRVDRWMHVEFTPPAMVKLDIGAAEAGTGAKEGDRSRGITVRNFNAITPETEKTTHYFWAQAQDFAQDDPTIMDLDFQFTHNAFLEDLEIIKAQQQVLDRDPGRPRVNIAADRGGILARQIIERLVEAEQRGAGPAVRSA